LETWTKYTPLETVLQNSVNENRCAEKKYYLDVRGLDGRDDGVLGGVAIFCHIDTPGVRYDEPLGVVRPATTSCSEGRLQIEWVARVGAVDAVEKAGAESVNFVDD
jgi:hypothetical protein